MFFLIIQNHPLVGLKKKNKTIAITKNIMSAVMGL
jgi:hypothetical protein